MSCQRFDLKRADTFDVTEDRGRAIFAEDDVVLPFVGMFRSRWS